MPDRGGRGAVGGALPARWLFVHVPKTGGTSIREALRESFGPGYFGAATSRNAHAPARFHAAEIGAEAWEGVLAFACVRNPYDRLVSTWAWARRFGGLQSGCFREWVAADCPLHPRMRVVRGRDPLWLTDPQAAWVADDSGDLLVTLLRFESLADDWRRIAQQIGANERLDRSNKSERGPANDYYDEKTRSLVRERYAADFEAFGYDPRGG